LHNKEQLFYCYTMIMLHHQLHVDVMFHHHLHVDYSCHMSAPIKVFGLMTTFLHFENVDLKLFLEHSLTLDYGTRALH